MAANLTTAPTTLPTVAPTTALNATFQVSRSAAGTPVLTVVPGSDTEQNTLFDRIAANFNTASPGSYKSILESIGRSYSTQQLNALLPDEEFNKVTDFYTSKNVSTPWNAATQGAKPPAGDFDATYYAQQNPDLVNRWNSAQSSVSFGGKKLPDVDITNRYTQDTFLHQHYTTTGQATGLRANPAQETAAANAYTETRRGLTDAERQRLRDSYLGVPGTTGPKPVDASVEQLVNMENQKKFNFLVQDVLAKTVAEVNKAKQQESTLELYRGLPGFDEIYNMRSNISNSLLGDTGIGGYLNLMGKGDVAKNLEKGIGQTLGMGNSVQYNWQKWFDEQLTNRYNTMTEIANPKDANEVLAIDSAFAKNFVDNYLKPRFDNSKSMSEFISYMNVTEDEQNVLQTQTVANRLKELATQRVNSYLGTLRGATQGNFNADFYFNPSAQGAPGKATLYNNQKASVNADWEAAKSNPEAMINGMTWNQWAYRYGVDLNNKAQFAKLHYELLGKSKGFDPSSDLPDINDLNVFINDQLTPYLASASESLGDSAFLSFMTPDQLADQLVATIDPLRTPAEWDAALKQYNIDGTGKTVDEVKQLILEATRTVPAADIRQRLLALNKKGITPTQERLGIEYIQRPGDEKKAATTGTTPLYNLFKSAGYGGTEDEFYTQFMTDTTKQEQQLMGSFLPGGKAPTLDLSDPFAALGSLESFDSLFSVGDTKPSTTSSKLTEEQITSDPTLQGMFSSFDGGTDTNIFGF